MDVDAPVLIGEIAQIIESHSGLSVCRLDNLIKIRAIQDVSILRPLKEILCFLDEKNILDQPLFNFVIENKYEIEQLSVFLIWLKELSASSGEALDFFKQLAHLNDIDKVITRLRELELRATFEVRTDFTFFSGLVDLINENMDEEKYIDLIRNVDNTSILLKALKILKQNDLLQDSYYEFVFDNENFYPIVKAELISNLKKNNALNEQNFNFCKKYTDLILLHEVVKILDRNNIFLSENFLSLATKNIHALFGYLKYLEKNSLVTRAQITAIKRASDNTLKYLIHIISLAEEVESPIELSLFIVEKSEKLRKLSKAFRLLNNENYLTLENYNLLATNAHYPDIVFQFSQALVVLRNNGLDDIRWKNEAYNSEYPLRLAFLFSELNKAGICSDTNVNLIKKINLPNYFLRVLRPLNRLHSLTEEIFENLMKLDRVLAFSDALYKKLSRMKNISIKLMTDLFLIASADLDRRTKLEKIEQLIELEGKALLNKPRLSINREQSTHVSSVQFSISQSAKRFQQKYGGKIIPNDLDKNFLEITDELKTLASDDNVKNRAALNALEKFISQSDFIEPISKLNFRELLVLLWEGINDDAELTSSLLDAKGQLIEGLYEIQRGGNIDAFGQDNGLPDEPICCIGAFNKLIEKMVGIHQFAEVINITPELAATKFPIVVKAKAIDYLINLEHEQLLLVYDLLKEEGVSFIWKHIASNVKEAMLAEFSPLYQLESGDVTENFRLLMASHKDLEIDEPFLASIKSAYSLKKFDLTTSVSDLPICGEMSGAGQRLMRSINNCFRKKTTNKKLFHPFYTLHPEFEYALSFFMGRLEPGLEKTIVEKIEILQKISKDKYFNSNPSDDFATAQLEGICEIWIIAERFLTENIDSNKANLIEFNSGEKKNYIAIKYDLQSVNSYGVYCPTFNKETFLEVNSEVALEEMVEIFKEILYPDVALYQVKTRYLSFFQPEHYLPLSDFIETLLGSEKLRSNQVDDFEGVPRKGLYKFFLFHAKEPTEADLHFLSDYGVQSAGLSLRLEKIPEMLSYLSDNEQIALGKLLLKYPIPHEEKQSLLLGDDLNKFNQDLLRLLLEYASKDKTISENQLNKLVRETCYSELIKTDYDSEETTKLLEDLVESHNHVKFKLENFVGVSRLSILLAPALIKALNGHSDNLIHLASMMGGDHLINESYLSLIQHEGFIKRFPKLASLLQKGQYVLASPICKLLLLSSFYELTKQLLNTPINTPEYRMAQSLLVDNTILFSALFAEAFGLELGPAGIILDLGITIHQLLIASDYIRQHYHLQVSLWEGLKFELGFNGIVKEILESREIVRLNLISINNLSKTFKYYFSNVILKGPKVVEIEAKKIARKDLPHFFLKKIYLAPLKEITSLNYLYKVNTYHSRVFSYTTLGYFKRQFFIESIQGIFINLTKQNSLLMQEDTLFVKSEKQCKLRAYSFDPTIGCRTSLFRDFTGRFFCVVKNCLGNLILTEGWAVVSSTTVNSQDTSRRLERTPSVILDGDIGAMMINKNSVGKEHILIKALILFNPHFGNMTVNDGSFLNKETLVVLIQDPPIADTIQNAPTSYVPLFNFTSFDYLTTLHYWVGFNSFASLIEDNFDCLSVYFIPLSSEDAEQAITMLSSSLKVGEKGPKFVGLEHKREIIIYFNRGYPLYGYFDFISPLIKLHSPTVKSKEVAIFGLEPKQICVLKNIQGTFILYSLGASEIGHEIIIQVTRIEANTNVNKQLNNEYIIESKQLLNFFNAAYNEFVWLSYNITELNISWCEIDCPLIKVRSKVSKFLDLTFKGQFKLVDKFYVAWFSFKAENMVCNFFNLEAVDLLLVNFTIFKELLDKGCTYFVFSKSGYLDERLKYNASEKKIIYQDVQYRLDEQYQFVAIRGKLINSSIHIENFENLLPNVAIDLRNESQPIRLASKTLQIGDRLFTELATTVLLLTKLGNQYMGLLPIFTRDEKFVAKLKGNVHEVNERGSVSRLIKNSDYKSDLSLVNFIKAISVLGSILTVSVLTKYIISSYRRINNPSATLQMGLVGAAIVAPLASQAVQTFNNNILSLTIEKKFENNSQLLQKNLSHRFSKQHIKEENRHTYNQRVAFFFEQLPQQVLFFNWCIGFYKKLILQKTNFSENNFEELLVILANELTNLPYSQAVTASQKKILQRLLSSIHSISFLIKANTACVCITKKTDFIIWNGFIHDLFVFEESFKCYLKKNGRSTVAWVIDELDTMSIEVSNRFLNCLDYLETTGRLLKMLASSANTSRIRQYHALGLPDFQWLIRRINALHDALIDIQNLRKLSFSEFKYYLTEILPEAKRLSSCLKNKYFTIDFPRYLDLVAAIKGDCWDDTLFQGSNINKASNVSIATRSFLIKESFFVNKKAANMAKVDYVANDCNSIDFSARNSNLRNISHSLG